MGSAKLVLLVLVSQLAFSTAHRDPLQARTGHLKLERTSILAALLALGKHTKVPLAILCADERFRNTSEVSVDIDNRSVADAISMITASQPDIRFKAEGGVVIIEPVPLPSECAFMNLTIPEFAAQRDTVEHLSAKLWMTLEVQLDPGRASFAGVLHPSTLDRKIGPVELRNRRVSELLNWMVQEHSGAAWPSFPCKNVKAATNDQLWKIAFYPPNDVP
jgi:hypothetical protein